MSKPKPLPPLSRLDELFEVRDGWLFNRIGRHKAAAGSRAGTLHKQSGYWFVGVDYQRYKIHRIIWAMVNQKDPGDLVIDHIDRNKQNNDPENLRAVTKRLNALNTDIYRDNSSGVRGVCWQARDRRWAAYVKENNRTVCLGYFKEKDDAITARQNWEERQWAA